MTAFDPCHIMQDDLEAVMRYSITSPHPVPMPYGTYDCLPFQAEVTVRYDDFTGEAEWTRVQLHGYRMKMDGTAGKLQSNPEFFPHGLKPPLYIQVICTDAVRDFLSRWRH